MLDYFDKIREVVDNVKGIANISSDIIESIFSVYKGKMSPNKLNGITSLVILLLLYPKVAVYSVSKKQDFKERLAKIKNADVDLWAKEKLSENIVSRRIKTLKNVG